MTTEQLYPRLLASTLAQLYYELSGGDWNEQAEAAKVRGFGIANCGETDFNLLVAEITDSFLK